MSPLVRHFQGLVRPRLMSRHTTKFFKSSDSESLPSKKVEGGALQKVEIDTEDPEVPKKSVFQELKKLQSSKPLYTIEQAGQYESSSGINIYFKYPALSAQHADTIYALRGIDNQDTLITHFPEVTDFLMIGSGLVGSATAYYVKKIINRVGDVCVLDKDPYTPHQCTALCNGLISSQSKNRDVSRIASLSKELIRALRNDVLVTKEDFAQIKYRPCTHLILWPEKDVDEVFKSNAVQLEDGCYTEIKLPQELENSFPWLKAVDSDIAIGSHGNQDEALVDPIGLRNLYRTLAQGYGACFIKAEVIDFNTMHHRMINTIHQLAAGAIVARLPGTGELRNLGFANTLLSLGHNTPFLENRAEMEPEMKDQFEDMHFLKPRLRIHFSFNSLNAPVVNFPVITDTDGSMLIKDSYAGDFKYFLTYEESETFLETDYDRFMDLESDDPHLNLIHKSELFKNYFKDVIKPRLVKRIPVMDDAEFIVAHSGFESHNSHDGNPIISPHPFHSKLLLSGGYGPRMMTFAPSAAATFAELMLGGEEETFDMTNFYWDRVIKGRKIDEFNKLIS